MPQNLPLSPAPILKKSGTLMDWFRACIGNTGFPVEALFASARADDEKIYLGSGWNGST